jgi:hypothetical protein
MAPYTYARIIWITILSFGTASPAIAETLTTQQSFQNVFQTAGYATALGAGLGAASLAFVDKPQNKLHHVTIGASIGFIAGSFYGSYLALNPSFSQDTKSMDYLATTRTQSQLEIRPNYNIEKSSVDSLVAVIHLKKF